MAEDIIQKMAWHALASENTQLKNALRRFLDGDELNDAEYATLCDDADALLNPASRPASEGQKP